MKHFRKIGIALSVSVVVFLILSTAPDVFAGEKDTSLRQVKEKSKKALQAIKEYTADQRDETVKDVEKILRDMDERIEKMETRIEKEWDAMDKAARKKAKATLKSLRKQRNKLSEWYGGIRHSSSGAWEEVKDGFIKSYHTLEKSFSKASEEF